MHNDNLNKILSILLLFLFLANTLSKELERFRFGKGNVLMDEAQLQLAEEKDYSQDFEEDLLGNEHGDIYDEHLAKLPQFELHKLGKNLGWIQLPIVTRKKPLWSTPSPKTRPFSHSWAWLYTKPPTAVTQKTKLSPFILSTTEAINKENKEEKSQIINRGTTKTINNSNKFNKNETNLTTKIIEQIKINKEQQLLNKAVKNEKERIFTATMTSTKAITTTSPTTTITTTIEKDERENLIERLRKLIKIANLRGIFPSNSNKVVVEVRSNVIAVKPSIDEKNVTQSGGFVLPRSWINEQDDSLVIQSWEKEHSRQPEHSILSPLQNDLNEKENLVSTQEPFTNLQLSQKTNQETSTIAKTPRKTIKTTPETTKTPMTTITNTKTTTMSITQTPIKTTKQTTTTPTTMTTLKTKTTTTNTLPKKKGIFKPTFIHSEKYRHKGPTFNCRVLDAAIDGKPSEYSDQTCDFPVSDDTCKCTYEVSGRDEEGCAIGFIYTCRRTQKPSNNELIN